MKKRLLSVVMLTVAAIMAFPLYYIVISTFKTQAEISQHPFVSTNVRDFSNLQCVQ